MAAPVFGQAPWLILMIGGRQTLIRLPGGVRTRIRTAGEHRAIAAGVERTGGEKGAEGARKGAARPILTLHCATISLTPAVGNGAASAG
jgi:hypothetical protein